jgi:putative N6-adenine-specific DNA methylase
MSDKDLVITIKTFFGLEEVLAAEIKELGFDDIQILNRAVQVQGSWKDVYNLNLNCRCALSVLVKLSSFRINEEKDLYKHASKIKWTELFDIKKTFAIRGVVNSTIFRNSQLPMLIVKDAIVDQFRDKYDERPNIETKAPQLLFDLYINENDVIISVNTSGLPLFHRGYREATGLAPLNEVVAAGLIRLSGWDLKAPLIDPFVGSGTIIIEAALMAAGIPATLERTHYAFKNLKDFDADAWNTLYDGAKRNAAKFENAIIGSDISDEMITKARRNARTFSVGRFIDFQNKSFEQMINLGEKGVVITNPPYGERFDVNVEELYSKLGTWMKTELEGWDCWIISSSEEGMNSIGLKSSRRIKLYNGDIACSFRKFEMYKGTKKLHKIGEFEARETMNLEEEEENQN